MTFTLKKLTIAQAEARSAARWYEQQRPKLGLAFLDSLDKTMTSILANPMRDGIRFGNVRRAPISRFSVYGVYYYIEEQDIVIIAIFHGRRDPEKLMRR